MSNQSENVYVPLEDEHDGDTAAEPTVKEIDNIYNWILDVEKWLLSQDPLQPDDTEDKMLQRMLLSLDRMSNSINRREEKEEKDCEGEIDVETYEKFIKRTEIY